MDTVIQQVTLFLTGFIANVLASLSGGGAGFVQLPVLIFLGLAFPMALGTHKVAVIALGVGAFIKNHRLSGQKLPIALLLVLVGWPMVILGSLVVIELPGYISELSVGFLNLGCLIYSNLRKDFGEQYTPAHYTNRELIIGGILIGLVAFLSGLFSSGAGLFAIMTLVVWFRLDLKQAIHYSMLYVALSWNFVGAATVGAFGQIYWPWTPALVLGAILGGYSGTTLVNILPAKKIKFLFQMMMLISSLLLIWKGMDHLFNTFPNAN